MSEEFHHVEPIIGEPLRYRVASSSRPELPYVVDLLENHGSGACRCPDFLCRREPNIKKGKPLYTSLTTCKHVRLAREYFTNTTLRTIADQLNKE